MKSTMVLLAAFVAASPCHAAPFSRAQAGPAPVHVQEGWLQGLTQGGLTVYEGIPFAAPPLGRLRWRSPRPAQRWSGVRLADHFGPTCMQDTRGEFGPGMRPLHVSEDCLYLNVWTPAKSAHAALPVMVWIYGGAFSSGSTAMPSSTAHVWRSTA